MNNFNHIDEVWEYLEKSKNIDELEEKIGEIPNKFGDFYIEDKGKYAIVTNTYFDKIYGEQEDTIEISF